MLDGNTTIYRVILHYCPVEAVWFTSFPEQDLYKTLLIADSAVISQLTKYINTHTNEYELFFSSYYYHEYQHRFIYEGYNYESDTYIYTWPEYNLIVDLYCNTLDLFYIDKAPAHLYLYLTPITENSIVLPSNLRGINIPPRVANKYCAYWN